MPLLRQASDRLRAVSTPFRLRTGNLLVRLLGPRPYRQIRVTFCYDIVDGAGPVAAIANDSFRLPIKKCHPLRTGWKKMQMIWVDCCWMIR